MDLKSYFRRLKEIEQELSGEAVMVVSLATPDGGREGVMTEAPRRVAAQSVLERRARLATTEEIEEFRKEEARKRSELEKTVERESEWRLGFPRPPVVRRK
jgi:hypothetical protein